MQPLASCIDAPAESTEQNSHARNRNKQRGATHPVVAAEFRGIFACGPMAAPQQRDVEIEHSRCECDEVDDARDRHDAFRKVAELLDKR